MSGLVVLTAASSSPESSAWRRAVDTAIGAAVGVVVSLVLPASRLVDARQTLDRLATSLSGVLETMGSGLQQPWTTDQTAEWRRTAHGARAIGSTRPPKRSATVGKLLGGTFAIDVTSTCSVATKRSCRASSGQRSASRPSRAVSTITPASPARHIRQCRQWGRCSSRWPVPCALGRKRSW